MQPEVIPVTATISPQLVNGPQQKPQREEPQASDLGLGQNLPPSYLCSLVATLRVVMVQAYPLVASILAGCPEHGS